MTELIQLLIYGVVLGGIITLGAIGVSFVFSILRFAHFAHGDLMTVGAYLALAFVVGFGVPVWYALPFAILGGVLIAVLIDTVLYRRLRRTAPVILLISSVGVALVLRSLVQLIWGPATAVYQTGITPPIRFGDLRIRPDHLYIVAGTVLLVMLLHLFLQRTKTGKSMRAMADDPDLARISGIDIDRVIIWTWVISATLAVSAGIFLGMDTRLQPTMGWHLLLAIFAAAIVGGIGRPYGAIAGGMLVGIASELSTMVLSPSYKPAVAFALMVVALIIRPTGIAGGTLFAERR
ncbi:branched-chain amino acid ABC transporter permease [Bradyrhizobium icense]|uniref:Amino acid ABC transporter permease n=1 Tax=Bradyrhizobium icense TaxID=1274631 RepID=A0A1B1UQG5_9BRAD|nr:branched-chain amino acid ABC transporter permease [Bradyrhizobium icense]ANW04918.1 amino acid ABC transporter permease [Bradyrhizobium icense]